MLRKMILRQINFRSRIGHWPTAHRHGSSTERPHARPADRPDEAHEKIAAENPDEVKSCKGHDTAAKEQLAKTRKDLKSAKNERKVIIAKLLKAQDARPKVSATWYWCLKLGAAGCGDKTKTVRHEHLETKQRP
jgi:hypothetical protein